MAAASASEGESLESWLNKATNPSNRQEDWEYVIGFCDQINKELEGPQIAVRLLAHKIQSPQEWEAVQALTVLEAGMKNCGRRFHSEVGKFRFLNELIKVVSPKYLGDRVSEKVKAKVIELLFSWTVALPEESKIKDAYQMLKRQGIVLSDPLIPVDRTLIPSPPPRPKNPVFDDEEKSKLLAKLLKSKNPDDLQEANKLIKSMVKEDEARIQKVTRRLHTLEEVSNNVKLLNEMLLHYSKEHSAPADRELMKELYDRCEAKRRALFRLASETEDDDGSLGDILQASDNLSQVIASYKRVVEGQVVNGEPETADPTPASEGPHPPDSLIDLSGLDGSCGTNPPGAPEPSPPPADIPILPPPPAAGPRSRSSSQTEPGPGTPAPTAAISLLDEELLCLGLADPAPGTALGEAVGSSQWDLFQNEQLDLDPFGRPTASGLGPGGSPGRALFQPSVQPTGASPALRPPAFPASLLLPAGSPAATASPPRAGPAAPPARLDPLEQLLEGARGSGGSLASVAPSSPAARARSATAAPAGPPLPLAAGPGSPLFPLPGSPLRTTELSLANVHVPLEAIRPSSVLPVTAYDKDGFRILFHFAKECPPGRPDVLVVVVSMLNTAPLPVTSILLQAAVPKSMRVKLQPPSGTELSPFSPIQPPAALTQVMLLANPLGEKVRLRYRLTFTLGEQLSTEVGEVDQFPAPEQWGNL
ncbi:ADP-ribosylation factor-binding protein GGA3 [Tachyglossus aculeatus]|uniref:ADP-ribosylation factor-binding protein GGA3 n=1 Tax=Tachyglossus aculeatus TaxID=9261 RepID=UPI0018F74E1E|nr:ADP-ribosylation factor-binding protein GGA3 [Tachyglossus aculeatus]